MKNFDIENSNDLSNVEVEFSQNWDPKSIAFTFKYRKFAKPKKRFIEYGEYDAGFTFYISSKEKLANIHFTSELKNVIAHELTHLIQGLKASNNKRKNFDPKKFKNDNKPSMLHLLKKGNLEAFRTYLSTKEEITAFASQIAIRIPFSEFKKILKEVSYDPDIKSKQDFDKKFKNDRRMKRKYEIEFLYRYLTFFKKTDRSLKRFLKTTYQYYKAK